MKYFAYYYLRFIFLLENVELKSKDKKFRSLKESLVFPVFVFPDLNFAFSLALCMGVGSQKLALLMAFSSNRIIHKMFL